jgi:hypothetical protein
MKFEFSQQIFEKVSNIKFHKNPVKWEPSFFMRTDGHDELNNRNFANAPISFGFKRLWLRVVCKLPPFFNAMNSFNAMIATIVFIE